MKFKHARLAHALAGLLLSSGVQAVGMDLLQAYRMAADYDATYRAEQSALDAAREYIPQARAHFLPNISASGNIGKNKTDVERTSGSTTTDRDYEYNDQTYRVSLTQPILRFRSIAQYKQAQAQLEQGEARFSGAQNDLYLRISQAYFDLLLAEDDLDLVRAEKAALEQQLRQSQNMYKGGVGTITDVHEAQARLDIVTSKEVHASNQLEIKRRQLEAFIGQRPQALAKLKSNLSLLNPDPDSYEHWWQLALEKNSEIRSKTAARDYSRQELMKSYAEHLPTLDAVASWTYQKNPGYSDIGITKANTMLGIQMSIPLFQGGGTVSHNRQMAAQYQQAQEDLDAATRKISTRLSEYYLTVKKGVVEVKALQQAVFSSESALHSTEMGYKAGTRTALDILNAQQQVFQSKRDLSRAKHEYILNLLMLKASAGMLQDADIMVINDWLEK